MSAAKKRKVSCDEEETSGAPEQLGCTSGILVDLGHGFHGWLHTQSPDDEIVNERWQQFKAELYKSKIWQLYCKETCENPSKTELEKVYKVTIESEIQKAWDGSENVKSLRIPDPEKDVRDSNAQGEDGEIAKETSHSESVAGEEMNPRMAQSGRLQRYLVTVEYAGTKFVGWQKQKSRPDLRTVQGTLENAFNTFIGHPVVCGGSSRTDTGVHALGNVCHIDAERVSKRKPGEYLPPHSPEVVQRAVNHFLQKDAGGDMMITNVRCVAPDFHARFQAKERTEYSPSTFERDRAWHVPESLDLQAMQTMIIYTVQEQKAMLYSMTQILCQDQQLPSAAGMGVTGFLKQRKEAAEELMGYHDFSSFRAVGCQAKSPLKTLDELHICEVPAWCCFPALEERVRYLAVAKTDVNPDSEVRLLVGTLKAVGCGNLTRPDVRRILNARSIKEVPAMAPAFGLYLAEVKYDFENPKIWKTPTSD